MDGKSLTPQEEKLKQLQAILPEAFTEGKVDWEKLQATLGKDINFANERYVLNWAGKSDAFKAMQQPSTRTLVPAKDESIDFDTTQNIFIEGENLEVLKILQKSYFGKVKMIYIDPPYNTGNDSFIYPDKFSETKEEYQKRVGDKDEEGYMTKEGLFHKNNKESGQYHSNWLNMMYPRLFLAKNLLRQDGVLFVSIDDHEAHNLISVLNEIFGEENFIANLAVQLNPRGRHLDKFIAKTHEYVLVYTKNSDNLNSMIGLEKEGKMVSEYDRDDNDEKGPYRILGLRNRNQSFNPTTRPKLYYPLYIDPNGLTVSLEKDDKHKLPVWPDTADGVKTCWTWGKEKVTKENHLLIAEHSGGDWKVFRKDYLLGEDGKAARTLPKSLWIDREINNDYGKQDIKDLLGGSVMSFPKSPYLNKKLMQFSTDENSIVMDFFSGSGTLAKATMDLNIDEGANRKYICVQLPEVCDEGSDAFKAGYKTIADIAKDRIRKASEKLKKENPKYKGDLGFKVFKLNDSNFKQWQISGKDAAALQEQMKLFVDPVSKDASTANMVYELLLKSGKDLNSSIEKKGNIYLVNGNELALLLEKADQATIDQVLKAAPEKVIALDRLFKDNDQLKTNTALQMKDAGIEFKTI